MGAAMSTIPHPVDLHVGRRVKLRRTGIGMSQERLGGLLDLTFQQIQKYERGANRIGSSRLYAISRVLEVPVSFFFEGIEGPEQPSSLPGLREAPAPFVADGLEPLHPSSPRRGEASELACAYHRIANPIVRRHIFDLVKSLASPESPPDHDAAGKTVR